MVDSLLILIVDLLAELGRLTLEENQIEVVDEPVAKVSEVVNRKIAKDQSIQSDSNLPSDYSTKSELKEEQV